MRSYLLSASSLVVIGVCIAAVIAEPCTPKFKNVEELTKAGETCTKQMLTQNATEGTTERVQKHGDMCIANCTLSELKVMANMTIQKDRLITLINENAPEAAKAQLITLMTTCANKAVKKEGKLGKVNPKFKAQVQGKKMPKMSKAHMECHVAHKFMKCFSEGDKMC